jgi:hypothetical protein
MGYWQQLMIVPIRFYPGKTSNEKETRLIIGIWMEDSVTVDRGHSVANFFSVIGKLM